MGNIESNLFNKKASDENNTSLISNISDNKSQLEAEPPNNNNIQLIPNKEISKKDEEQKKEETQKNIYESISFENGDKYQGNCVENKMNGKGKYYVKSRLIYEGYFKNNHFEGKGTYYWKNGDSYTGIFKGGKFHGNGTIKFTNGNIFKGEFINDKRDGFGEMFIEKKGQKIYEFWQNGKLKIQDKNENIVKNYMLHNCRDIDRHSADGTSTSPEKKKRKSVKEQNQLHLKLNHNAFTDKKKLTYKIRSSKSLFNLLSHKDISDIKNHDILNWTKDDVQQYFLSRGLEKYVPWLRKQSITGKKLIKISDETIAKEFEGDDLNLILTHIEFLKFLTNEQNTEKKDNKNLIDLFTIKENKEENNEENISGDKKKIPEEKEKILDSFHSVEKNKDNKYQLSSVKPKSKSRPILTERTNQFCSLIKDNRLNYFINFNDIKLGKEPIGKGSFGEVYKGEWLGMQVAVKKFIYKNTKDNKDNKEILENEFKKFLNEINILASMRHPNIVLYMGASVDEQNCYMITEYVPEDSLGKLLHKKKKKLRDRQKISIALQLATAIHYMHFRNIVHRDLKSDNVLLTENKIFKRENQNTKYNSNVDIENYKVKLADFGLSLHLKNIRGLKISVGTYPWMAPEIMKAERYTKCADIFSYGMIIWELLTEQKPYKNFKRKEEFIEEVANKKKIVEIPEEGNEVLKILAKECLHYNPEYRPSIEKIVDFLYKANNFYRNMEPITQELYDFVS